MKVFIALVLVALFALVSSEEEKERGVGTLLHAAAAVDASSRGDHGGAVYHGISAWRDDDYDGWDYAYDSASRKDVSEKRDSKDYD